MAVDPLTAALDLGNTLIQRIFPDPAQANQAKLELLKLQQTGELAVMTAQTGINQEEAKNANIFVSGWRPAIGWICAFALAYQYLVRPLGSFLAAAFNHPVGALPGLDDNLWQLMMGMLGLGSLRTYEKVTGATK